MVNHQACYEHKSLRWQQRARWRQALCEEGHGQWGDPEKATAQCKPCEWDGEGVSKQRLARLHGEAVKATGSDKELEGEVSVLLNPKKYHNQQGQT